MHYSINSAYLYCFLALLFSVNLEIFRFAAAELCSSMFRLNIKLDKSLKQNDFIAFVMKPLVLQNELISKFSSF